MDEYLPSERMVLALLAMVWQGAAPPGPYQLSLTTHPCNPSKWFNMEQLPPLSTEDIMQDVITTLPLKEGQARMMLFMVTGQRERCHFSFCILLRGISTNELLG